MKKKVFLSGILTIVLCFSLIAGATFALFTSTAKVNVALTSATVKMTAEIKSATMDSEVKAGSPIGSAQVASDGASVDLLYLAPGDFANVAIAIDNQSNINVVYKITAEISGDLAPVLVASTTIDGSDYTSSANKLETTWIALDNGNDPASDIIIKVLFPNGDTDGSVDNDYQGKTASIAITVQAVQANAI